MKVGLFTKSVPETVGGGHVLRDDVARAAVDFKGRHHFEIVTLPHRPSRSRLVRPFRRLLPRRRPLEEALFEEVRKQQIDVLWFNHFKPIDAGVPYILNIFDMQHRLQPWFPEVSENGLWDQREKTWSRAVLRASIVTVGSEEAKEQISFFYGVPLERIHAIPLPTPQSAIDGAATAPVADGGALLREKYGIKGDFLYYPAQFWAHKNHVNLLHAIRLLRDEHGILVRLALTGSNQGNQDYIEKIASNLGLGDDVHFLGFVPREDVLALYRNALALAFVSFFGPENLPPLEAMALECPVVLSDIAGVRTLFGDAPVFVDPRDPASIASGIAALHGDPALRRKKVALGRAIALQNTSANYVSHLHEILDGFEPFRRCWP
jgi:glycosyltransferase involved in cell wall biosynthesis